MKKTREKKFKVRIFYHLQNLFWGFCRGVYVRGGFVRVSFHLISAKKPYFTVIHSKNIALYMFGDFLSQWWRHHKLYSACFNCLTVITGFWTKITEKRLRKEILLKIFQRLRKLSENMMNPGWDFIKSHLAQCRNFHLKKWYPEKRHAACSPHRSRITTS